MKANQKQINRKLELIEETQTESCMSMLVEKRTLKQPKLKKKNNVSSIQKYSSIKESTKRTKRFNKAMPECPAVISAMSI